MLPARPRITLLAPRHLVPGTSALLTVQLDAPRTTPIDFVDLFVVGNESLQEGHREPLRLGARLRGAGELPKGRTELECRVELPASMSPSYEGTRVRARCEAQVHVSVPYWPDAHGAFQLTVRPPPRAPSVDGTLLFSSADGGAPVTGPYAEVSLATRSVAPGDVLSGAIALYNVAPCRYDRVIVSLRQKEDELIVAAWSIDVVPGVFEEGQPRTFSLRVPEVAPSMQIGGVRLHHELAVTAHSGWRELLNMPIPIDVLSETPREDLRRRSAPALGEDRVRALWASAATTERMTFENDELLVREGDLTLAVRRQVYDGMPLLVAEVRHPALGLALRSFPRPRFRLDLGNVLKTGIEAIDATLSFEARSHEQAADWLARVSRGALPLLNARVVFHEIGDASTALAFADSGTTEAAISAAARAGKQLAFVLRGLVPTIPLPPRLPEAAWTALALRLGAPLERGTGLMEWEREDARVSVRPLFDEEGAVYALRIAHAETSPLEIGPTVTTCSAEGLTWLREEARGIAAVLVERGVELHLASDQVAITAKLDTHWKTDELAPSTERAVNGLARLASALRAARGPFR